MSELAARTIARPVSLKMKEAFSKSFCWKTISLVHTFWNLTDLVGELIKKEILIATGMVWLVSSDK